MTDSVAIIGSGAIAGVMTAWLGAAGRERPVLCARTPVDGFTVTGDGMGGAGSRYHPVTSVAVDAATVCDWVVLTVKAHDTAATRPWLDALVGPGTVVVVAQNGVDHVERVQPLVPGATVLPTLVFAAVERTAPGQVHHQLGAQLVVPRGEAGQRFADLMTPGVAVTQASDFTTAAWRKLLVNIASNPVTALTLRRCEVLSDPEIDELSRGLLAETAAVGRAVGAELTDDDVANVLGMYRGFPPDNGSSMLHDRLADRPLEHDLLSGAVVRSARRHDVDVPLNHAVWALTRALSQGTAGS